MAMQKQESEIRLLGGWKKWLKHIPTKWWWKNGENLIPQEQIGNIVKKHHFKQTQVIPT